MKKFICCIFAATLSLCAYAQPVITAANITPVAGEPFIYNTDIGEDTVYFAGPGPSGAAVIWDFHVMPSGGTATGAYTVCAATPFCDSFPSSNLAVLRYLTWPSGTDTSYFYYIATPSNYTNLGSFSYSGENAYYGLSTLKTPIVFGDVYLDTEYHKPTFGSAYIYDPLTSVDTVSVDGYGTLILPSGAVNNVLRVKRSSNAASTHYEEYTWYSADYHSFLFTLIIQYDFGTDIPAYNNFAYMATPTPAGIKNTVTDYHIKIYPNPATDLINLSFTLDDATGAAIILSDITGRTIQTITNIAQGDNKIVINAADLASGLYTIHLQTSSGTTTQKITITK